MNIEDIKTSILLNIDDPKGDLFTDDQLNLLIKRGFNHIYNKMISCNINPNVTSREITFAANQQEVLVGLTGASSGTDIIVSDLQKPLYCKDSDGLKIPILDMETSLNSEQRSVYIRRNFTNNRREEHYLGYYITPSASLTVTLYYIPKIVDDFSSINPQSIIEFVPAEFHDVVINYITMLCLGKDNMKVQFWMDIYKESLSDMLDIANNSPTKFEGVVDVTEQEEWV